MQPDGSPRGPFDVVGTAQDPVGSVVPALWNNDAAVQTSMLTAPDSVLVKRPDAPPGRARIIWECSASHIHINTHVSYRSQSLVAAYTAERVVGGRAWPGIFAGCAEYERPLALWCNSVFGISAYWAVAGSQHPGRGMIARTSLASLPVPDFSRIGAARLREMAGLFDTMSGAELAPIADMADDPARRRIDDGLVSMFGMRAPGGGPPDLERLLYGPLSAAMRPERHI